MEKIHKNKGRGVPSYREKPSYRALLVSCFAQTRKRGKTYLAPRTVVKKNAEQRGRLRKGMAETNFLLFQKNRTIANSMTLRTGSAEKESKSNFGQPKFWEKRRSPVPRGLLATRAKKLRGREILPWEGKGPSDRRKGREISGRLRRCFKEVPSFVSGTHRDLSKGKGGGGRGG